MDADSPSPALEDGGFAEAKHVLVHLAVGLLRQNEAIGRGIAKPVTDLDEQLQWGWDKLTTLCYLQGVQPPRHLPDLVAWLHQPVESWDGLGSFFARAELTGSLLCWGMPSEFCMDLGRDMHLSDDPERELQDTPFKEILAYCKKHHLVDQYRQARQFLVEHPYLPDGGITITRDASWDPEIRTWLRCCYETLPLVCHRQIGGQAHIAQCPRCGWPLEWRSSQHSIAVCYSELCGNLVKQIHDPVIWEPAAPESMRTTRGIQFSVVGPEVVLLDLVRQLERTYGRACDLWPEIDSYDAVIPLSGNTFWAADLKDHQSPTRLANSVRGFRSVPQWDKAFFVFPDHRRRPGYLRTFLSLWQKPKDQDIEVLFLSDFLQKIEEHERDWRENHA